MKDNSAETVLWWSTLTAEERQSIRRLIIYVACGGNCGRRLRVRNYRAFMDRPWCRYCARKRKAA